jgi:hypothetical protein
MHRQRHLATFYCGDKHILLTLLVVSVLFTMQSCGLQTNGDENSNKPAFSVYIDHQGNVVLKVPFALAQPFSEDLAAVQENGKIGFIDKTGKCVIQPRFPAQRVYGNALGADGICRPVPMDPDIKSCSFSEGLAAVPITDDRFHRWGYINKTGKIVIPANFQSAGEFHERLAMVGTKDSAEFIDKTGHCIISAKSIDQTNSDPKLISLAQKNTCLAGQNELYSSTIKYSQGLAPFATPSGYFGYIDKKGNYVIKPEFIEAHPFHEDMAGICKGIWVEKIVKRKGKDVPEYSCSTDKWSFIDLKGKPLFEKTFQFADDFAEGLAPVKMASKWGFVNKNGQLVIKPQFDWAYPFSDGLACVKLDNKYGCIDHKGLVVIKPIYKQKLQFNQGLAPIAESP